MLISETNEHLEWKSKDFLLSRSPKYRDFVLNKNAYVSLALETVLETRRGPKIETIRF